MVRARCLLIFLLITSSAYSNDLKLFFKKTDAFFQTYVKAGKVDYMAIAQSPDDLNLLLSNIASIDPGSLHGKKLKAYLINVYNLFVIDQVLRFYPLISPYEAKGFFTRRDFNYGGRSVNLHEVKEMLMKKYSDIRIYGLLCDGSLGSPMLKDHCCKAHGLNRALKQRFKNMSGDRNFVRLVPKASLILLSDIFRGYEKYFTKEEIERGINKYRKEKLIPAFEIKFFPGNCNLNIKAAF
jgi:hypothetical protein